MSTRRGVVARPVRVHIDELRLEGFDPRDRYPIADALERELERLFGRAEAHPALEATAETERLDAGTIRLHEGERAGRVGEAVARAVFRGMTRERGR